MFSSVSRFIHISRKCWVFSVIIVFAFYQIVKHIFPRVLNVCLSVEGSISRSTRLLNSEQLIASLKNTRKIQNWNHVSL